MPEGLLASAAPRLLRGHMSRKGTHAEREVTGEAHTWSVARIERTHRLTGMPREEIVRRGLIYGQIPMYAVMSAGCTIRPLLCGRLMTTLPATDAARVPHRDDQSRRAVDQPLHQALSRYGAAVESAKDVPR